MIFNYDEQSELWLEPFSLIIHCMFPLEGIYNQWFESQEQMKIEQLNRDVFLTSTEYKVLTGSLAEGICIPTLFVSSNERLEYSFETGFLDTIQWKSDIDKMEISSHTYKTVNNSEIPIFTAKHVKDDKRYVKLRLTDQWKKEKPRFENETFLHQTFLLPTFLENSQVPTETQSVRGPVCNRILEESISLIGGKMPFSYSDLDDALVFTYPIVWPKHAMKWLVRYRKNEWPSAELIQDIFESGCHIAPIGRGSRYDRFVERLEYMRNPFLPTSECSNNVEEMDGFEWRTSFSIAENKLGASISPAQRYIIVLLKMIKKMYFPEDICTYHLKNLLFWEIESTGEEFWSITNTFKCLLHLLDRLLECVRNKRLPHYFIPESNLFSTMSAERSVEVAGIIENIRSNIVSHMLTMMRRVQSMGLNIKEFICRLKLGDFIKGIKSRTTNMELFYKSILHYLIKELKLTVEMKRNAYDIALITISDNTDAHQRLKMLIYSYQSVLARIMCHLWLVHKHYNESRKSFLSFVFGELESIQKVNYMPNIEDTCLTYFQSLVENGNLSDGILNSVTFLKDRLQSIYYGTQINDGTIPDLVGIIGDEKEMRANTIKTITEIGWENVTKELIHDIQCNQYKPVNDSVVLQHLSDKRMLEPLMAFFNEQAEIEMTLSSNNKEVLSVLDSLTG